MGDLSSNFERDPRRQQELRGRPYADAIYRSVFGEGITVKRFDHTENYLLDKEFAIDVQITFPVGLILTGQEKFLSSDCAKYRTLTTEYMQDPTTNERGDWFKMAVQFYFVGYELQTRTGFYPWAIVDWASVVLETIKNNINWSVRSNGNGRARASFKYTSIDSLPDSCIIAKSNTGG